MSRRTLTHLRAEPSGQDTSAETGRVHLLAATVDRLKRIDRYIDYFGSGGPRRIGITRDPCGESFLDADGAR
jgi:hypothetical protein